MMVVDTSALMAIILNQDEADVCEECLIEEDEVLISAGTAAEALSVAQGRRLREKMTQAIEKYTFEIVPVTAEAAQRIGRIYETWGKGMHPAGLNFGDCFAYELAQSRGCRLLYVGNDFSRTDILSAL